MNQRNNNTLDISNQGLKKRLNALYEQFMEELQIDHQTGVLGRISNPNYKNQVGLIRFSGYPFIGSQYDSSSPKVLVVGLDIGIDECRENNTYHSFDSRNKCIEPTKQSENWYNKHIAGTYGVIMFLLKDYYGWSNYWGKYFDNKTETFETILKNYGPTVLPFDVLSHVAFTNIHKFVTIGRDEHRSGDENRKWYNPQEERALFKAEISCFTPEIVYIQGQSKFDWELLEFLKAAGYRIVLSDHPSSWRNGANIPSYVRKLNLINW